MPAGLPASTERPPTMDTPAQILTRFQSALRTMRRAIDAHETERAALADYLRERTEETQREKTRREAIIETARVEETTARNEATRCRAQVEALFRGVEEGTVDVPDDVPLTSSETAQVVDVANAVSDELDRAQARLEPTQA